MSDTNIDGIILEIEATTDKADRGIDKTIEGLKAMRGALNGIDTQKLKKALEPTEEFEKRLKGAFQNIKIGGNAEELRKQIAAAEARFDSLLRKENKLQTVGGVDENSRSFRSLQYDIAETCNQLDSLYDALKKLETAKPKNFWERPGWFDRLKEYGTTDEKAIKLRVDTSEAQDTLESVAETLKTDFSQIQGAENAATDAIKSMGEALGAVGAESARAGNALSGISGTMKTVRESFTNSGADKLSEDLQNAVDVINLAKYQMKQMEQGNVRFDASAYRQVAEDLAKARQELNRVKDAANGSPEAISNISRCIGQMGDMVGKCGLGTFSSTLIGISSMLSSIHANAVAAGAGFQSMAAGLQAVQAAIPIIGIVLTLITALLNGVNAVKNKINNAVSKIISTTRNAAVSVAAFVRSAGKSIKSHFEGMAANIKSSAGKIRSAFSTVISKIRETSKELKDRLGFKDDPFKNLKKKLRSFTRLFSFMLLRKAFTKFFELVRSGFENLVLYSKEFGTEFHRSVNQLYSDLHWVGNAFSTAFEPILNVVTPYLDLFMEKLADAATALSMFFSALTGNKTYTRAIRLNEDYAASLDKAKKAANGLAAGIDELNILHDNSKDDNDGKTDPKDSFVTEEVPSDVLDLAEMIREAWENIDLTGIGRIIGEKLKNALDNIDWSGIKKSLKKIAKRIATLLNGFLSTPGLFSGIGKTIGEAINSAFAFINEFSITFDWEALGTAVMNGIEGLLNTIDWEAAEEAITNLATGVTTLINTVFARREVFKKIGDAIANAVNLGITYFSTIVTGLNWDEIGLSIGAMLSKALTRIRLSAASIALASAISGVCEAMGNAVIKFDWSTLATNISTAINDFFKNLKWDDYITSDETGQTKFHLGIKKAFSYLGWKLGEWLSDIITGIDPERLGKTIGEAINTLIGFASRFMSHIEFGTIAANIMTAIGAAIDTIGEGFKNAESVFAKLGTEVAEAINTVFSARETFEKIGNALANAINLGFTFFGEIIGTLHFDEIGLSLGTAIGGFFETLQFPEAAGKLATALSGLVEMAAATFAGFDDETGGFGSKIAEAINNFLNGLKWEDYITIDENGEEHMHIGIKNAFGFIGMKLGTWLSEIFTEIDPVKFGNAIGNAINSLFSMIGDFAGSIDFEQIGSNIAAAINTAVSTIDWKKAGETINTLVLGIGDLVTTVIHQVDWKLLMGGVATALNEIDWLEILKDVFDVFASVWTFKNIFKKVSIAAIGLEIIGGIKEGISDALSNIEDWLKEHFVDPVVNFVKSLFGIHSPSTVFSEIGGLLIDGLIGGLSGKFSECMVKVKEWAGNVKDWFTGGDGNGNIFEKFKEFGGKIISDFRNKIGSDYTNAKDKIQKFANSVKSWFEKPDGVKTLVSSFTSIGSNIIQGFLDGVSSLWNTAMSKIKEFGRAIIGAGQEGTEEHSPSRAFKQIGAYVVEGFNIGLGSEGKKTKEVMNSWIQSFRDMNINIGSNIIFDDSALRNVRPNYGENFTNDVIVRKVREEVASQGTVQAALKFAGIENIANAIMEASDRETSLLAESVERLEEIAAKEFGITDGAIAKSMQRSSYEHYIRTGKPILQY